MEDVLALYQRPSTPEEPLVCLDERPVVLHAPARPDLPATGPGQIARRDYEYVRCGTANVFYVLEPQAGRHRAKVTRQRTGAEFAKFMNEVARTYPKARTIHAVMDNLNIHCVKSLTDFYGPQKGQALWARFHVHYTPKHASWLDMAEMGLSLFSRQCLGRRRLDNLQTLAAEARAWSHAISRQHRTIDWTFTVEKARTCFKYSPCDFSRPRH